MPRAPWIRYYESRFAYYTQQCGKQYLLARGSDDAPDGPTYFRAVERFARIIGSVSKRRKPEETRRRAMTWVYFIRQVRGPVKIGHARDVDQRLATIQTCSPQEVELLGVMPGGGDMERCLHKLFAKLRIRGEWFRFTRTIERFIEKNTTLYEPATHAPRPPDLTTEMYAAMGLPEPSA